MNLQQLHIRDLHRSIVGFDDAVQATENVSIMPSAPVSVTTRVPLIAGNTSGCTLGMSKLSTTASSPIFITIPRLEVTVAVSLETINKN
jgi:hypothetical protein